MRYAEFETERAAEISCRSSVFAWNFNIDGLCVSKVDVVGPS